VLAVQALSGSKHLQYYLLFIYVRWIASLWEGAFELACGAWLWCMVCEANLFSSVIGCDSNEPGIWLMLPCQWLARASIDN